MMEELLALPMVELLILLEELKEELLDLLMGEPFGLVMELALQPEGWEQEAKWMRT